MALPEEFLNQYRQQTGNRQPHSPIGASALSIAWSLCSGGIWARNVSIGRRAVVTEKGGKRSYPQVRLTDPEQSVHARDTWQHTDRYRTVTDPYPPRHPGKTKLRTDARCAHACSAYLAMLTRGGGARSKRGRDSQPPTHPRISPETCTNRRQGELPSRPHPRRRPQPPRRAKNGRDRCKSPWRSCGMAAQLGCRRPSAPARRSASSCRRP